MADLDPQVQIHIIELAWKWADNVRSDGTTPQKYIDFHTEHFERAYKAMAKAVTEK
jgi:hypothetical protein